MKTYYLTSFWKYYSLLSSSVLFWFVIGALAYQGEYFDFVFLAAILGLADAARTFYNAPTSHIIVSKAGVVWHGLGFTLSTSWKDIEKISHRVYGFSIQEGLAVTKLKVRINETGVGYLPTAWQSPPVRPFIPLSCFVDNWRASELEKQIQQYAPHLFENLPSLRGGS
ncbi:MAG TPA: hypothetical protein VFR47_25125 [Anaerolineales bacterium]|nr:hypothetical protein [Anaerolineales bacterium]